MQTSFMRAVVLNAPGGAEQLQVHSLPIPEPAPNEVLVQVKAAGVNRPDILQRRGLYPPPLGVNPNLGLEVAGVVVGLGANASPNLLGQTVMALCNGGGYAEYVSVPALHLMSIPGGLDFVEAAALPEVYMTVWQNLVWKAQLGKGQSVLIHGGSSGIGTAAIQLCKRLGAKVFVTVSNAEKSAYCKKLGADHAFLYPADDWVEGVKELTRGQGVHVVLDMVAGDYLNKNLSALAPRGILLLIGLLGGRMANIDVAKLLMKQVVLTGTTLRSQGLEVKATLAGEVNKDLMEGFSVGQYQSCVQAQFSLENVAQAHQLMESGDSVGKIVLNLEM
jgi:NADPH2:quinone reductase